MEAQDGLAAYELIKELKTDPKLIIIDIQMPRMNGAELAERLRTEYPNTKSFASRGTTTGCIRNVITS